MLFKGLLNNSVFFKEIRVQGKRLHSCGTSERFLGSLSTQTDLLQSVMLLLFTSILFVVRRHPERVSPPFWWMWD